MVSPYDSMTLYQIYVEANIVQHMYKLQASLELLEESTTLNSIQQEAL